MRFLYMEALHARGLTTAAKVLDIPQDSFRDALAGTVAYDKALDIYALASKEPLKGKADTRPGPGSSFRPVNDGDLVDCVAPCHLSPLGPMAYLFDALAFSDGTGTLRTALKSQRGDFGSLLVTAPNLALPLPAVDIVNENLEAFALGITDKVYQGPMHNTLDKGLVDLKLSDTDKLEAASGLTATDLLRAIPQHSTPSLLPPTSGSSIFSRLKSEVGKPCLPYSQGLDISRTYLKALGTTRFETMRTFHRDITELPQLGDGFGEPPSFEKTLWRLPMRRDIALESICISPEEASLGLPTDDMEALVSLGVERRALLHPGREVIPVPHLLDLLGVPYCEFLELHGSGIVPFAPDMDDEISATSFPPRLPCWPNKISARFSRETFPGDLLRLIIFARLWKRLRLRCSPTTRKLSAKVLADVCVVLGLFSIQPTKNVDVNDQFLTQLASLLILKEEWCLPWTRVAGAATKPPPSSGDLGDERTELLALWSNSARGTDRYRWAVDELLDGVERYSVSRLGCRRRPASWRKIVPSNLDDLAALAGFEPSVPWNAKPTCTIRFAEILSKLYASNFTPGEMMFLFTTRDHIRGDDPFPFTEADESLDDPLNVPEDDRVHGLWSLRQGLLDIDVTDEEASKWSWARIESILHEMGYSDDSPQGGGGGNLNNNGNSEEKIGPLRFLAEHFFPEMLERHGYGSISSNRRRFEAPILSSQTSRQMWLQQHEECTPFHLDTTPRPAPRPADAVAADAAAVTARIPPPSGDPKPVTMTLWTALPLRNEDVTRALRELRQLNGSEAAAIRQLYAAPRNALAPFGLLFDNFERALETLVRERDAETRFRFFQTQVAKFVKRCRFVARFLHGAVVAATEDNRDRDSEVGRHGKERGCACGRKFEEVHTTSHGEHHHGDKHKHHDEKEECPGVKVAWAILLRLAADENHDGAHPGLTGGSFAALLSLMGTGLLGAYYRGNAASAGGGPSWAETRGGMSGWAEANNRWNTPLLTVIPDITTPAGPLQSAIASFKNGLSLNQASGELLTGAEPFSVIWSGSLLIEADGHYHFAMKCPHHTESGLGECHCEKHTQWHVSIERGQKRWTLLRQGNVGRDGGDDDDDDDRGSAAPPKSYSDSVSLRRGAYDIMVIFKQREPDFDDTDDLQRFHTGFALNYKGPDTQGCLVEVPMKALYIRSRYGPYSSSEEGRRREQLNKAPGLEGRYVSSLRDIRRTYQRAFKGVLFAHQLRLSACQHACDWGTELDYILDNGPRFTGVTYYRSGQAYVRHEAPLDLDLLPVGDAYFPPSQAADDRANPDQKRSAAMFGWFERLFDYTQLRKWVCDEGKPPVWQLFSHAQADSPQPIEQLVRFLGVEIALAGQALKYFIQPGGIWQASTEDLADERWTTRVWLAGRYMRRLRKHFYAPMIEVTHTLPALWASSPDANVVIDGTSGNINLTLFVQRCCLAKSDAPHRLKLIIELNDGLRLRGRDAILAFLASGSYKFSHTDLSKKLLLDVDAGIEETTTRVDDAIAVVHRFMQRLLLGFKDTSFRPGLEAVKQWSCEFSSFEKWQAAQRRKHYIENWIQWEEERRLAPCEGFQSLRKSLKADVSTISVPVRGQFWQQPRLPPVPGKSGVSSDQSFALTGRNVSQSRAEGLDVLGTPDHSARPTWLTKVPEKEDNDKQAVASVLPGADSLASIPLWIQSAVRLGARFVRVAASGLPVGVPYRKNVSWCCICKRDHAPVVDEYYFWLEDGVRFDPADAPAPQNADTHFNDQVDDDNTNQGHRPKAKTHQKRPQALTVAPTPAGERNIDPRTRDADPTSDWDAPTPEMLAWKGQPIIHLRWTRVHMGMLQDPRRSSEGISLTEAEARSVFFDVVGREGDSLFFDVVGKQQLSDNKKSFKAFRYDIATDAAVVLPEAIDSGDPPKSQLVLPNKDLQDALTAFPFFLYFEPGAPLVPVGAFSTSLAVASFLRTDCRYQEASYWLRRAYDPLNRDNTWIQCDKDSNVGETASSSSKEGTPRPPDSAVPPKAGDGVRGVTTNTQKERSGDLPCCDTSPVKGRKAAHDRAAVLEYAENLLDWANSLRCQNSLAATQQALTLLGVMEHILGPAPTQIKATDMTKGSMTLGSFKPYLAPLNPRLMDLYAGVEDALSDLRNRLNKRRLKNGALGVEMAHFGSHRRFDAGLSSAGVPSCSDDDDAACCFSSCQPYRFSFVHPKAMSWAALAKSTAASMLSAMEKADSEALSSLRLAQERQMADLGLELAKNNYRAADWEVQALDKQMANALTRLQYFQKLVQDGLNTGETAYVFTTGASTASRTGATVVDAIAQGMSAVPDMWVGIAGAAGSPLQFNQMPMGVKLGTGFATAARILNTVADISSTSAGLSQTQGGWDRREVEWQHTVDTTTIEIQQIKRQRLAARRRLDNALRELNNTQRRIEHAAEVQDFARDKSSRYSLYLYLQHENAALYRQCFEAALRTAHEAQQALVYELGDPSLNSFVPREAEVWESLHAGLLAGDKLEMALYAMERAHTARNCREYELQKHVSLRLHFPAAFVMLKATGRCEVDLPEWLFDLDYPGHYMRRIRSVSLTVPCVAGPYTGVHCRLQQLSSAIRFRPRRLLRGECTCCSSSPTPKRYEQSYDEDCCPNDPNVWRRYAGTEAIATSAGQNDAGLFEVSFSDTRYLPFEFSGAVSRWRIDLPPENNQFDFDSLSDVVMHVSFTAREGGAPFARLSGQLAQRHVPGDGWRFFDVRHEMPEVWNVLRRDDVRDGLHQHHGHGPGTTCGYCRRTFTLSLTRHKFPFLTGRRRNLTVTSLHLLLDTGSSGSGDCCHDDDKEIKATTIRFIPPHQNYHHHITHGYGHAGGSGSDDQPRGPKPAPPPCVDTEDIPLVRAEDGLLKGSLTLKTPVLLDDADAGRGSAACGGVVGEFALPRELRGVKGAWLLCGYRSLERECGGRCGGCGGCSNEGVMMSE